MKLGSTVSKVSCLLSSLYFLSEYFCVVYVSSFAVTIIEFDKENNLEKKEEELESVVTALGHTQTTA